jgi:hypothetical protein
VLFRSLRDWEKTGWELDDRRYRASAVGTLELAATTKLEQCISLLGCAMLGLQLPRWITNDIPAALRVGSDGRCVWKLQHDASLDELDPDGGHCVLAKGYLDQGPGGQGGVLIATWGQDVWCTWPFFWACCQEAYGVVDQRDEWVTHPGIDVGLLDSYLAQVQARP